MLEVALLSVFAVSVRASIPDGRWQTAVTRPLEEVWTQLTSESEGRRTLCPDLGRLVLTDPSQFPSHCHSRASVLGSDTFDVDANRSQCHFRSCGSLGDISFIEESGGWSSYTLLTSGWRQLTRSLDGVSLDCLHLGSHSPSRGTFPVACQMRAAAEGADSFEATADQSQCHFKRCGRPEEIRFTAVSSGGMDSFTLLGSPFQQITLASHGVASDCEYLRSTTPATSQAQQPGGDELVRACSSQAFVHGADTFDLQAGTCYLKRCRTLSALIFTERFGPHETYTTLGGLWSQVTRAQDGHSVDCQEVGSLVITAADDFPRACYSKALILGSDTLDVDAGYSLCEFKRCGQGNQLTFKSLGGGQAGRESHTILQGPWSELAGEHEGVSLDCETLGVHTSLAVQETLQACFSRGALLGANAVAVDPMSQQCQLSRCNSYSDIRLIEAEQGHAVYTNLSPPRPTGWGVCNSPDCLDLHLLYTAETAGQHLAMTARGVPCDPEDDAACFGGAARRAGFMELKQREFAAKKEALLCLELGKSTFGGPLWDHPDYPKGMPSTLLQNLMPYDACIVSQGDFMTEDSDDARRELAASYSNRTCTFVLSNTHFRGLWQEFNQNTARWTVKETPGGAKIALVGIFPYTTEYGYTYGKQTLDLDPHSILTSVLNGSLELQLDPQELQRQLIVLDRFEVLLSSHFQDVLTVSSLVPMDALIASAEARRQHPDVGVVVLMFPGRRRPDTLEWLLKYGDFDIILRGHYEEPRLVRSSMTGRQVLLAGSRPSSGLGHLRVRVRQGVGVERFQLDRDVPLDAGVPSNQTVQSLMSHLYQARRERVGKPFGQLTNPLVGGHRGDEQPPSASQCYYTECNAGTVIGEALLWKAQKVAKVHVSLYNLGGLRAPLRGDSNLTVSLHHCVRTLAFQNRLKLYRILGFSLYSLIRNFIRTGERTLMGAGFRVAFHEPCWRFVNHTNYHRTVGENPPGTRSEIERCQREANVADPNPIVIDVEVLHLEAGDMKVWRLLEKGSTYMVASTDYLMQKYASDYEDMDIDLGADAEVLCEFVGAKTPLQVDSWEVYRDRGNIQYPTPQEAWAAGARVGSVVQSTSLVESTSLCRPGMHLPPGALSCEDCPAGKHSRAGSGLERPECHACSPGFFGNTSGRTGCELCEPGFYTSLPGSTSCESCLPGHFSDEVGAAACTSCSLGSFAQEPGSSRCQACPLGAFADRKRSTACELCGPTLLTLHPAATSLQQCLCPEGQYWPSDPHGLVASCQRCPQGLICPLGSNLSRSGDTARYPVLRPNHWSSLEEPLSVFKCHSALKCPGGEIGTACAARLRGQACERCSGRFYWGGSHCIACLDSAFVYPALPLVLTPVMVAAAYALMLSPLPKWDNWKGAIGVVFYVLLGHYQASSILGSAVQTAPASVQTKFAMMEHITSIVGIFEYNCYGLDTFAAQIVSAALLPIFVALVAFATMLFSWCLARSTSRSHLIMHFDGTHNVIGHFLFTFFSVIVAQALTLFKCVENPNGLQTLTADRSITCYQSGGEWQEMLIVGVASAVVYCTLVASLYARAILIAPRNGNLRNASFQLRWKFLFVKFRPSCYWFGAVCLAANLLLNLGPVVFRDQTWVAYWLMTLVMVYAAIIMVYMPYRYCTANWFELLCCSNLVQSCAWLVPLLNPDQGALSTLADMQHFFSFVPLVGAVTALFYILRRQWQLQSGAFEAKLEEEFEELQRCCAELAELPAKIGTLVFSNVGELDRQLMQRFCHLMQAELFGKHNRLSSGSTRRSIVSHVSISTAKSRSSHQSSDSATADLATNPEEADADVSMQEDTEHAERQPAKQDIDGVLRMSL